MDRGESSWDPPQQGFGAQQGYGAQVVWNLMPVSGAYQPAPGSVGNGQEQVLGRYDMVEQSVYVSREQCAVQVAADGSAKLVSLGKPPTLVRARKFWASALRAFLAARMIVLIAITATLPHGSALRARARNVLSHVLLVWMAPGA